MDKIDLSKISMEDNPSPPEVETTDPQVNEPDVNLDTTSPEPTMVEQVEENEEPNAIPESVIEDTPEVTEETPSWMSEYENAEAMFTALNELKNAPQPEAPKEEFDEFIKGAIEYYKETGDLTPYLEAKTVDYSALSDKEVFAKKLRSDYPNISEKAFERLLDKEISNRFGELESDYDDGEDDETSLARELLKAEADKLRSKFKEQQEKFSAPEREVNELSEEEVAKQQAEAMAEAEKKILSNSFVKGFMKEDTLKVKYGGEEFNYEPEDKNKMVEMTKDLNGFMQLFSTGDESNPVDFEKWFTVMAFAQDPDNFLKGVRTAAKAVGTKNVIDEIRNPSVKNTSNTTTSPQGSIKDQLLEAALKAKK